ncbi:MAG: hypothetical protein HN392_13635 [Anaerolineae bacterium]|jgi:hypothetical protein|nr:hypothetical protein [Anaerolineae bacterium]MBT7074723.1 hypothetical protein [Anaerolineae bacterium]MBT7782153.1 hypothetical protein [Anaerolineae bacterium]
MSKIPTIERARLILRPLSMDDAISLQKIIGQGDMLHIGLKTERNVQYHRVPKRRLTNYV